MAPWTGVKLQVPAKFIIGDLDLVYQIPGIQDYMNSGAFQKDVPLLQDVVVVKGVAHFINQEIPDEISNHIYEFIKEY
jgi:hypothetical protein